jgi:hypothetical protein
VCGGGHGKQANHSQGADQIHFHEVLLAALEARETRLPSLMTGRYNFRVIISWYITLDRW